MISWNDIVKPLMWYLGTCFLATVIVMVMFTKYPKYIVYAYYRYQYFKFSLRKKKASLSPNFSFSYLERGSENSIRPSVLLVHGLTGTKEQYLAVIKNLPHHFHIISVDLFGHGETSVNEDEVYSISTYVNYLKKFVDLVGLSERKFHLVGSSLGGHIVGMYSIAYPDDLLSLTMMCPHGISFEEEKQMKEEADKTQKFFLITENVEEFRALVHRTHHKQFEIPSIIAGGLQQMRSEKNIFYKKALTALYEPHSIHQLEKNLHNINTPLVIIWGKEDKIISIDCLETIKEKLSTPAKKIVVLENVGHSMYFERPKKCAFILLEFFNTFD